MYFFLRALLPISPKFQKIDNVQVIKIFFCRHSQNFFIEIHIPDKETMIQKKENSYSSNKKKCSWNFYKQCSAGKWIISPKLICEGVYKTDMFFTEALFFTLIPKTAPENQVHLNYSVTPLLIWRIISTVSTTEPKEYVGFQKKMVTVSTQRGTNSPEL